MRILKLAVVGAGALGKHHARILAGLDRVELVAVADVNAAAAQAVAEANGTNWTTDFRELIGRVDAACIVVPTTLHLAVAREFLERGIPVLVEKPLAANLRDAQTIVAVAQRHGTLLQVGHVERFNPATQTAWKHCGEPKYIRCERLSPYAFRSTDIGVVHDVMIHDLDLVLDLNHAPVRSVEAFGISLLGEHEDTVQARVTFENGCIADLTANRVNPDTRRAMQIWSADSTVSVDFAAREVTVYRPSETLLYGTSPLEHARRPGADVEQLKQEMFGTYITVERPAVPRTDALTEELLSFVACIAAGTTPLVDGQAALRAMELAEQVLDKVAAHQWDGHAGGAIGPFARSAIVTRRAG